MVLFRASQGEKRKTTVEPCRARAQLNNVLHMKKKSSSCARAPPAGNFDAPP
jgi:hypothetical protein